MIVVVQLVWVVVLGHYSDCLIQLWQLFLTSFYVVYYFLNKKFFSSNFRFNGNLNGVCVLFSVEFMRFHLKITFVLSLYYLIFRMFQVFCNLKVWQCSYRWMWIHLTHGKKFVRVTQIVRSYNLLTSAQFWERKKVSLYLPTQRHSNYFSCIKWLWTENHEKRRKKRYDKCWNRVLGAIVLVGQRATCCCRIGCECSTEWKRFEKRLSRRQTDGYTR